MLRDVAALRCQAKLMLRSDTRGHCKPGSFGFRMGRSKKLKCLLFAVVKALLVFSAKLVLTPGS